MHGVQANAKAIPMIGAAHVPSVDGRTSKRLSPVIRVSTPSGPAPRRAQNRAGTVPRSRTSPRRITTNPLTWVSVSLCEARRWPMPEAAAPRATKTTVKPAMKRPMPRSIGRMVAARRSRERWPSQ